MSKKGKIALAIVILLLIAATSVAVLYSISISTSKATLAETVQSLRGENSRLHQQLDIALTPPASAPDSTPSSNAASMVSSAASLPQNSQDAETAAEKVLVAVAEKYYTTGNKASPAKQYSAVEALLTDTLKKSFAPPTNSDNLEGMEPVPSGHTYTTTCSIQRTYAHKVDANTINVLAVAENAMATDAHITSRYISIISGRAVQQNGKWLLDTIKVATPEGLQMDDVQ